MPRTKVLDVNWCDRSKHQQASPAQGFCLVGWDYASAASLGTWLGTHAQEPPTT